MDGRRQQIADAALRVLARAGSRGLTHHAVDDAAGLARGSVSYYCRRRSDLLELTLDRLLELDLADLRRAGREAQDGDAPTAIARLVVRWLTGARRERTRARFELFLLAAREPALQAKLAGQLDAFLALGEGIAAGVGARLPPGGVAGAVMAVDGLLLTHVRLDLPRPGVDEVAALLAPVLRGEPLQP